MTQEEENRIVNAVKSAVQSTVNGKIDHLNEKLDVHLQQHARDQDETERFRVIFLKSQEDVKSLIETKGNLTFLVKTILTVSGLAATWLTIKSFFMH